MKKLVFICLSFLFTLYGLSQSSINNFIIENGDLKWQKVYDIEITQEKLTDFLTHGGYFEKIESQEGTISGNIRAFEADISGTGYARGSLPIYVIKYDIKCFTSIEFKPGRYRVTVSHINLIQRWDDPSGDHGQVYSPETWALTNDAKFTANFVKRPSVVYDYNFNKIFEYKESNDDDNW